MISKKRNAGDIRREIHQHEAAIRALESELRQFEAASIPPRQDLASAAELEVYHRRRRLVDELATAAPGVPLMVAQIEEAADLVEGGLDIETAIRQVTVGAN